MRLDLPDGGGGSMEKPEMAFVGSSDDIQSSQGSDYRQEQTIAGLIIYKLENNLLKYLLLKKVGGDDWSPPKGHVEENEDCYDGAEREVFEETGFAPGDYETLAKYPIYFEYMSDHQVLKKVHIWIAKILNFEKHLRISPEHDQFQWLDYEQCIEMVKREYHDAFMAADLVIRTCETL